MTGDRLHMPAAMSAEAAERLSDVHRGDIPKWVLDQAREDLAEKLRAGETVGRCAIHDLLDCELNGERYKIILDEMMGVLRAPRGEHGAKADAVVEGLIERYLSLGLGEEAVHERAEDILADRECE